MFKPRSVALPALTLMLAATGLTAGSAPATAAAGTLMQRPNRVTPNPVTTTNKVLVAVPTDRLHEYDYLYVVQPRVVEAHGIPVTVGGATPFNSTLVVMNAPLLEARDGFWGVNYLRAEESGFRSFSLGSSAPEGNRNLGEEAEQLRDGLAKPVTVIASAGPRLAELPDSLQMDPWALLNAGRNRDAGEVFAGMPASPQRDAGMALAAALLGQVDRAGEALAELDTAALPDMLPMGPGLATRARALATDLYAGSPAAGALNTIADAAVRSSDLQK